MLTGRRASAAVALLGVLAGCDGTDLAGPTEPTRDASARIAEPRPTALSFGDDAAPATCLAEGTAFGRWELRYHGYGCVALERVGRDLTLFMTPTAAESDEVTHAPLAIGPAHGDRLTMRASVETLQQTRRGGTPNPWEVAWVVWQYQDDEHFYYFIPKPNGWELGKRDPAYPGGQRFLATGEDRLFPAGEVYDVVVQQNGTLISVSVNGEPLVRFRDVERPYRSGRFALYSEDAAIRVHGVSAL